MEYGNHPCCTLEDSTVHEINHNGTNYRVFAACIHEAQMYADYVQQGGLDEYITERIIFAASTLTQPIDCTGDPLDDPNCCTECGNPYDDSDGPMCQTCADWIVTDNCCTECGSVEPCDCFDEDDSASEVTGYDNGPTYW